MTYNAKVLEESGAYMAWI